MNAHPARGGSLSLSHLRSEIRGQVIGPDDDGYDEARTLAYSAVDRRPAAIVQAAGTDDVVLAVSCARDAGIELAVRSGGHSGAGHSTCDGGIVLDLRAMKALEIDADERTAWAQAGLTAGEFTTAASAHGLAVGFGDTGSVGLGGLTLGGGVGYLARKQGLTIDSLLAAEIVTADGRLRRIDADSDPDLFWAIRGGGGNFGVATRFQFRLHQVDEVVGGMLVLPATVQSVAGFVAASEAASDELTTIANVMNCPPLPFVAEEHHGSLVIMALMCFAGDRTAGEEAMRPFRELATPLADLVRPLPYADIYPPEDPDYHPTAVSKTMFIDRVDEPTAATIMERLGSSDASLRVAQLRVLGGAIARVAPNATAYAHRTSRIMVNVAAFYDGPQDRPQRLTWVDDFADALRQEDDGVYVNFLGDEGTTRVRAAYPKGTWDRLAEIKARHDPDNVFRLNQNIPPAGAAPDGR